MISKIDLKKLFVLIRRKYALTETLYRANCRTVAGTCMCITGICNKLC